MITESMQPKQSSKRSWPRRIGLALAGLFAVVLVLIVAGVLLTPDYTSKETVAGFPINQIVYLTMNEETEIFISVWLPPELKEGEKIPTLIRTERYADQLELGWLGKALETYTGGIDENYKNAQNLLDAGFAFVLVQSPGSGQSSGPRPSEYPPSEIEAIGMAIDWISQQPWSNERIGAYGHSYSATTADMSIAALRPQLKAVFPDAPDFDQYTGVTKPGGLGSNEFIHTWGGLIQDMDADNTLGWLAAVSNRPLSLIERILLPTVIKGLKRPDGEDIAIFEQALEDHQSNQTPEELLNWLEFHDAAEAVALYQYKDQIERAQVNTYTRVGWLDAGVAEGALQKYLTFDTPQILVIAPTAHSGLRFVDLFGTDPDQSPHEPGWTDSDMLDYFARHLKSEEDFTEERLIIYYTYGSGTWQETTVWPPQGIQEQTLYFGENGTLTTLIPETTTGSDDYTVDFTASTGEQNRWMGQLGRPVQYDDRRQEDEKLIYYTTPPMESDLEITGSPNLVMHVASTHTDGAFYVYLEDIGPDGRVTYLTEGLLRAIHRTTFAPESAPYVSLGVYHTFREADAMPLVPGEVTEIAITLNPISVVIRAGHALRVTIAGYDASMQNRHPESGVPTLTFQRNSAHPSHIQIPVMVTRKVVPVIDRRYALTEVPEALRYFGEGHARGKVVITVAHNDKT